MDPNRPSPYQPGSPPQSPPPQPGVFTQPPASPYQPGPPPQQTTSYPPQPAPTYSQQTGFTGAAPAPQQQQPTAPASWYTPVPKPDDTRPNDASAYLKQTGVDSQPTSTQTPGATGQMINGQYSIDYLDQLAAPTSHGIDKRFIFVGIAGAVALVAAALMIFSTPQAASTQTEVSLYTTMVDTETSTRQSGRLIKNSQLAAVNSNLRTTLSNATRDMEEPLSSMGQTPSSLKSAATKAPYHDDKFVAALEDARLNGVYDRVYANEIGTKVRFILTYMESIERTNSRDSMQSFISNNKKSFETIQKSIDDIQESSDINL